MGLILILFLTSLSIAGSAAYFSVLGLAAMFSAAYWPVVVMGGSLELGKLVAASFVYRTWKTTGLLMKTYLITAILLLMAITSLGIFGFLSKGYGDSTQMLNQVEQTTAAKQIEVDQVNERLDQINRIIEAVPNNYVTKRIELQREYAPELEELSDKRNALRQEMADLRHKKQEADAHVGPILYVADMFGVSTQDAVKFFILALILVFDPMAVILTLATNHAIEQWQIKRAQKLAEKREHELAMAHETHQNVAPERAEAAQQGDPEPLEPMDTDAVERMLADGKSEGDFGLPEVNGPVPPMLEVPEPAPEPKPAPKAEPLVTSVPTKVSAKAVRKEPTVSEMNAVLRQNAKPVVEPKAGTQSTAAPLEIDPEAKPSGNDLMIAGVAIPEAILATLNPSDQKLLRGLSRGLTGQTLSSSLGMTDVNLRKRALYLAERLNASGYAVNPKALFA